MSEQITITSDNGILTIDMSRFYNDENLDKIVVGILDRDDRTILTF